MQFIKSVGNRVEGMGFKIPKFHSILHMAEDIINFGVPYEVDTGSNESGHKLEKLAAKLTMTEVNLPDKVPMLTSNKGTPAHFARLSQNYNSG